MKKNLSIMFVVMIFISLFLSACGGGKSVDTKAIIGTWTNDATGTAWTYTADGKLTSSEGVNATYVFDGSKVTITNSDGTVIAPTVVITGNKLVETAGDGTVTNYTKSE